MVRRPPAGVSAVGRSHAVVREGDVLAGKYRIERILGVGGMGMVVAALHVELDQRFAIKFLLPEMLTNSDAVLRFTREARAAVRIKGEHVARVFDVGTLESGAPYMVMEYLDGIDLGTWASFIATSSRRTFSAFAAPTVD
jgi:serine/threonine-protein kinase